MLTLDTLFEEDARTAGSPKVQGKWFEIRITPDLVTGELLNIGVGFVQARTKAFHFRLLESAQAFGCMYGPQGREQFEFLLGVVRQTLHIHGAAATLPQNISFGPPRFAAGDSGPAIVETMFNTVVTLARRAIALTDVEDPSHKGAGLRSTESVRKRIRRAFKKRDEKGFLDYWRDAPVEVRVDDVLHPLDCQVWKGKDLVSSDCFASIVSSCYRDEHYRRSFLTGAYHSLTIARAYSSSAKGGFFILAPDAHGTYASLITKINNEIDHTTWILRKKFNIAPEVETSMETIKEKALAFTA